MTERNTATAVAHPNIALIKYWGNKDSNLRLPANGSISLTLQGLETHTSVTFDPSLETDIVFVGGNPLSGESLQRVTDHLDRIRKLASINMAAQVESRSNFPMGVGLASSASAFAALTLAATAAADLSLEPRELSRLGRLGSGSACRSIFGGFVEWHAGENDRDSYAESIAPSEHWDLYNVIAIVSKDHKGVGSTLGHEIAASSPVQEARVADASRRLQTCRQAILTRDFSALAPIVEQDSNLMHAVMITSSPPLIYWLPATIEVMHAVVEWRGEGLDVCYTVDAGPNVHCLCMKHHAAEVQTRLSRIPGVLETIRTLPGAPARLENAVMAG